MQKSRGGNVAFTSSFSIFDFHIIATPNPVIRRPSKEKMIVAHFDHSLRGDESDGDRYFIAKFCEENTITFEYEKLDI
jgi:hypothetical protein